MPFTITANWFSFSTNTIANPNQINDNFSWVEGNLYPHIDGNLTNGVYDLGTTSKEFKNMYLSNYLQVGNLTLTSDVLKQGNARGWLKALFSPAFTTVAYYNCRAASIAGTVTGATIQFTTTVHLSVCSFFVTPYGNGSTFSSGWITQVNATTTGGGNLYVYFIDKTGAIVDPYGFLFSAIGREL